MATISEAVAIALQHCQAGRFQAAEQLFRQILQVEPGHAAACNNLGNVLQEQGKLDDAIHWYRKALELSPEYALVHGNLGGALHAQGKLDEAVQCYQRALHLAPDFVQAHNNLGVALQAQGKLPQAAACFRRAIQIRPDYIDALNNLGNLQREQFSPPGQAANPLDWNAMVLNVGPGLTAPGNLVGESAADETEVCYRRVVELRPDDAGAQNNLGGALWHRGKIDEAVARYRRAIQLKPDFADAHCNLGVALASEGKLDEAVASYQRALELKPDSVDTYNNLGVVRLEQGKFDEAMACCRQVLSIQPDYAEAHMGLALVRLIRGEFQAAWPEYEWRWRTKNWLQRSFSQPLWDGSPLAGKTILLHREQGLGDAIQFIRYAPLVKQRGGTVIVECQKALLPLLATCPGIDRLIAFGDEIPKFDIHAPLLSLMKIFQTSLDTIPAAVPYLFASPALIDVWREKLRNISGYRIGINWQGNPDRRDRRTRDLPLQQFATLAAIPGVQLISLQKDARREELAQARERFPIADLGDEADGANGAFMDTAAIMMNLDLVISSDTSIAHLAGALGVPVWVALLQIPEWRWLLDRADSPWYPSMRLFRQPTRGDWAAVFQEMQQAVCQRLGAAPLPAASPPTTEPEQPPAAGKTGDPRVATTTISEAVATAIEHCEAKRFEAAEEIFRRIIEVEPGNAAVHNNLGNALQEQGKLEEAVVCYRRALELQPDFAMPYNNLGGALHWLGELDEAVRCYEQALKLNPDFIDAHNNLAITHLLRGDFSRGWPEYEWRWGTKQFTPRNFPQPLWDGSPLTGKTILLHAEQGLGDTFQFIRYAPLVKRLGGTVIVECQNALRPLIARSPGIDQLIGQGDAIPPFDTHAPLLTLPKILRTSLDNIPAAVPYLSAAPALVDSWREKLRSVPGYRIGINWQGRPGRGHWRFRNIPLLEFAPLAKIPGVRLISLQRGSGREELAQATAQFSVADLGEEVDQGCGAFMDTAAIMMNLDLVISSDTAVAHLAGALGIPVWVALPQVPDWRWLLGRPDSPWYPTMQLFRQTARRDWTTVFQEISRAVRQRLQRPADPEQDHPAARSPAQDAPILISVSAGELIDKITILEIKAARFTDAEKIRNVRHELELLTAARDRVVEPSARLNELTGQLASVNAELWRIEDAIRDCERGEDFGPRFVELARSVYHSNDRRFELKREINELVGSNLVEEKSYAPY